MHKRKPYDKETNCTQKNTIKHQKPLAQIQNGVYTSNCCGMIAVKREVATQCGRFFRGANVKLGNWRQVTVQSNNVYKK